MKNKFCIIFLGIVFLLQFSVSKSSDLGSILSDDFNSSVNDFQNMGKFLNLSHLFIATQILMSDVMVMQNDVSVRNYFKENRNDGLESYLEITNRFANPPAVGFPIGVYSVGLIFKNDNIRKTGRLLFESMLISTFITQSTKIILGRSRPFNNEGSNKFTFFAFNDSNWSHPSGHSTLAFSFATILAFRINQWWSYPLFYGLAASTGLARIYFDKHWLSDVFMGAAIGTASSLLVLSSSNLTDKSSKSNNKLSVYPSMNFINFTYCW